MSLKRRKILSQMMNLGFGTDTVPADAGGSLTGDKIGIHTFLGTAYVSAADFTGADAGAKLTAAATAIAAISSAGGTIDCRSLIGAQTISSTATFSVPIALRLGSSTISCSANPAFSTTTGLSVIGSGRDHSIIQQSITTNTLFSIAAVGQFHLADLTIQSASKQTSGAAVLLTGTGGSNTNLRSHIENVQFLNQWISFDSAQAAYWDVEGCDFNGVQSIGIRINNPYSGDEGDNHIHNCLFSVDLTKTTVDAIQWISGGGLYLSGSKFQQLFKYCIHVNWNPPTLGKDTTVCMITDNAFEPQLTGGAVFYAEQANGSIQGFVFSDNWARMAVGQLGSFIVFAAGSSQVFATVAITGNNIYMPCAATAIQLLGNANGDLCEIVGNVIYGGAGPASVGINIVNTGTSYGSVNVGQNNWQGLLTQITGSGYPSALIGFKVPDNAYFGAPTSAALTNRLNIDNAHYLASRNFADGAWKKLIGQDASDIVQIAADAQATNIGGTTTSVGAIKGPTYNTTTQCANTGAPAVCGAAPAGFVVIAAAGASVQVNTTAVTANSQIFITFDETLGTALSVTCNSAAASQAAKYFVAARGVGAFTIQTTEAGGPVANPACLSYLIVN